MDSSKRICTETMGTSQHVATQVMEIAFYEISLMVLNTLTFCEYFMSYRDIERIYDGMIGTIMRLTTNDT